MRISSLVLASLVAVIGGCKGDAKQCEDACRNGFTVTFWAKQEREIANAPTDMRERLRRHRQDDLQAELDRGMDLCSSQCVAANDSEGAACMIKAVTEDQVRACMPEKQ